MPAEVAEAYASIDESPDYNVDVKPILSDKCFACHGPDKAKQKAGLRLDQQNSAYAELPEDKGKVAIDPGNLDNSELYHRIISNDPKYMMPTPKSHLSLNAREKAVLLRWISDGAKYKPHWAFVAPGKPAVPELKNKNSTARNPIDHFVLNKLLAKKLKPSGEAGKELLLRRLFFDLTGLPPTISQIDSFLNDSSPQAYEKQVNNLLASPHFGERMAVDWLDAARFADSHGYTVDRIRDMSPYRDWVIKAFNKNMPYDRFLQWQLAGDLMPNPSREMLIATAFNRNHQQNMEGGIIEEEYQSEYVVDRTNTFGDAVIGLSVGCAKCHDHKYDPITQKNYYELYSFFNNVKEAGQISFDDAMPSPTLLLPDAQKEKILGMINDQINDQEEKIKAERKSADGRFTKWMASRGYRELLSSKIPENGLTAKFSFDRANLQADNNRRLRGAMVRESGAPAGDPDLIDTHGGKAIRLNGDDWLDLGPTGIFKRSEPFSVGISVNIPAELKDGVILHKCVAERLYNFRGYYLAIKNGKAELGMAHVAPSNAITKTSPNDIPRDKWIHFTITYDGSSRASGLRLYLNGNELPMETVTDQLTKEITFADPSQIIGGKQPGLQIGGWWRGAGLKNGLADDIAVYKRMISPLEIAILSGKTTWAEAIRKSQTDPAQKEDFRTYYLTAVDPVIRSEQLELSGLRKKLSDSTENIDELMIMQETSAPKPTYLLKRGNYDMPGERVYPGTPASILSFPKDLPGNRYGLAMWATNRKNPLTARVAVNRIWQGFFGIGLVKTAEDFGNQGEMPSNPELMDWLAVNFMESGWNLKKLVKTIVMSATYRQDSKASPEAIEKDPDNRFLSHGPSFRLTAEMIRDNALMASGLINLQTGGRSVKPYQPPGLWEINNTSYTPDTGKAVYRRSLYVIVKRSVPNPTLSTFDASSRSYCIMRRQNTNTPLQALVTLNDPTFVEASKVMGEQMTREQDNTKAIIYAYRKLTGLKPDQKELDLLTALFQNELKKFKAHPGKQKGWLDTGQYHVDTHLDPAVVAANAVVANTILNSDASLTKR